MTDQPTFEYHDEDGDDLSVRPMRGIPAVLILTGTNGIAVDLDRVEEVIAGIRDAARTAARQTTGHDDTGAAPVGRCTVMLQGGGRCEKRADHRPPGSDDPHTPEPAVVQPDPAVVERFIQHMASQPDPTTADDPTPLRWGHGDVLHGDDDSIIVCLSGPGPDHRPYWLKLDAERAAAFRDDLTPPSTVEPQDHPGADLYVRLRKAGEDHDTAQALIYAHARMAVREHTAIHGDAPAVGQPEPALERLHLAATQWRLAYTAGDLSVAWDEAAVTVLALIDNPDVTWTDLGLFNRPAITGHAVVAPAVGQPAEAHDTEPPLCVWQVVREDEQTGYNLYGTVDDAKRGSIHCWEEDEAPRTDYQWRPFGDGWELLVGDESSGIVINRLNVYGAHFTAARQGAETRAAADTVEDER